MGEKKTDFSENKEWIKLILALLFLESSDFDNSNVPMFPYASNDYLAGKVDAYEKILFWEG